MCIQLNNYLSFSQVSRYVSSLDVIAPDMWSKEGKCMISAEEHMLKSISSSMVNKSC